MPDELISFDSIQTLRAVMSLEEIASMLEVTVDYILLEFIPSPLGGGV